MLGILFVFQFVTGLLLRLRYTRADSFNVVYSMCWDVFYGENFRALHAGGVSVIFVCLYIHMFRGFVYSRYFKTPVWLFGVSIFLIFVMEAFLGYVLP